MKHLRPYNLFKESKVFEATKSLVDSYLSKLDTTRQDIIDIFQGIIDLGFKPKFKLVYLDKDGKPRDEKSSAEETPLLTVKFESSKEKYVGGSIRFDNLNYIENLYHSLAMFMSMFKDKCHIEYDLDNMIELKLRLTFETEYDESKVSISKDEISDALESCLSVIPEGYSSKVINDYRGLVLEAEPDTTIGQKLLDELIASKTEIGRAHV